jgi:hypothetical protein
MFIASGSLVNEYTDSFFGRLWEKLLNRHIFFTLRVAQVLIARRQNTKTGQAAQLLGLSAFGTEAIRSRWDALLFGCGVPAVARLAQNVAQTVGSSGGPK